jgi:serine/threonine protein kinase
MKKHTYSTISFLLLNFPFLSAGVDVATYQRANPDPLDAIPENATFHLGEKIGEGTCGTVYSVIIPEVENGQQFILKIGNTANETTIGQTIRYIRHNVTEETQLVDTQGFDLVVPGKLLKMPIRIISAEISAEILDELNESDEIFSVQERVQGENLLDFALSPIDSPKKTLERLCGLMSSLYALEKADIIHNDLYAQNIMVEKRKLPDEVITAKAEAKARQMTGITGERKDLTEENKRVLNEAIAIARANLPPEDQYDHVFRIIDFGYACKVDADEPYENLSKDMNNVGILMPFFLFGNMGTKAWPIGLNSYSPWNTHFAQIARMELIRDKKNSEKEQDQLALEIMFFENNMKPLNDIMSSLTGKLSCLRMEIPTGGESIPEKTAELRAKIELQAKTKSQAEIGTLQTEIDILQAEISTLKREEANSQAEINILQTKITEIQTQIEAKNKTYATIYGESIQEYKARFESDLKMRTDAGRNQYVTEKFHEANAAMQAEIGKSYPEPVLTELAQFTANCLSEDPTQVPTAKEGYQKITDLFFFSNWPSGQ